MLFKDYSPITYTNTEEYDMNVWFIVDGYDGEFGEFTLGKTKPRSRILDEKSFHIGIDKSLSDDGDLFGFALGLGEDRPADRNYDSHVESRNYSFSTYGKFDDGSLHPSEVLPVAGLFIIMFLGLQLATGGAYAPDSAKYGG